MRRAAVRLVAGCLLVAVWEVVATVAGSGAVAAPWTTAQSLWSELGSHGTWSAIATTLEAAAGGLGIGAAIGIPLGLLIGRHRLSRDATVGLIEFLKPIPPVVLLPIALLLYGTHLIMQFALVTYGALWPILMQVAAGARSVDATTLDACAVYRVRRSRRVLRVIVPATAPFIFRGLRLAASITLITAVTIELVGNAAGIGSLLVDTQATGQLAPTYALVLIAGVLGVLVNLAFSLVERHLTSWRPAFR